MENNLINKTNYMEQTKSSRPLLSTAAAIALGLSAIIVTSIIVGGVVILRGVDIIETLETLDINVTGDINEDEGEVQVNVGVNQNSITENIDWGNMPLSEIVPLVENASLDGQIMMDQPISFFSR